MLIAFINFISLLRIPAAFLFLNLNPAVRLFAIMIAIVTDWLDGFLARKYNASSKLGTILDPISDKFFVCFVLAVFYQENRIELWQVFFMLAREFSLLSFACYLWLKGIWNKFIILSVSAGKIFTTLQYLVLIGLSYGIIFPWFIYLPFFILGILFFKELRASSKNRSKI